MLAPCLACPLIRRLLRERCGVVNELNEAGAVRTEARPPLRGLIRPKWARGHARNNVRGIRLLADDRGGAIF